jgi:competence protein ComEC
VGEGANRVTTEGRSDIDIQWTGAAPLTTRRSPTPSARGLRDWISAQLLIQSDRWALWSPVAFGCGCGVYFGLRREPRLWPLVVLAAAMWLAALALRRWSRAPVLAGAVLIAAFAASGLLAGKVQTLDLAGPIAPPLAGVTVEGCGIMAQAPEA